MKNFNRKKDLDNIYLVHLETAIDIFSLFGLFSFGFFDNLLLLIFYLRILKQFPENV
jgi:hypothetical protein